jgi:hypothetical protein
MIFVHVAISGIATGLLVLAAMLRGHFPPGLTAIFLATTLLTSLTGFLFPISAFTPALATGVLSTVVPAFALLVLYVFRLANTWRPVYVVAAMAALYLNVFVAIVQAFQKLGPLQVLAPTQSEPPFLVAQGVALALFAIAGLLRRRRSGPR